MWGTQYVQEIQKQFVSRYNFAPNAHGLPIHVPDGEYPMWVEGRYDLVKVTNGLMSCCNFDTSKDIKKGWIDHVYSTLGRFFGVSRRSSKRR